MRAYLLTLPPVRRANRPHELPWYLRTRLAAAAWKLVNFRPGRFTADPARDASWNRGAYLVRHLGHCGECHTARNALGAVVAGEELAGNPHGPEDKAVPNITPEDRTGIGMLPDGDFAGAGMGEVIDDNTSQLTGEDRRAIATYLKALPPRPSRASAGRSP
jgi:mono/diheme cytochrome c family protein